jgi:ABC-type transporter Mla MlaB component
MLRITKTGTPDGRARFHLEGRLTAPELPLLRASLAGRAPSELAFDLSELRWIDAPAVATLADLIKAGAWLVACSPFIEQLLGEAPR